MKVFRKSELFSEQKLIRSSKRSGVYDEPGTPLHNVINLHIADLLPPDPKPDRKDTSAYRLNDRDVKT